MSLFKYIWYILLQICIMSVLYVGLGLSVYTWMLCLISTVLPYWSYLKQGRQTIHAGLWTNCTVRNDKTNCVVPSEGDQLDFFVQKYNYSCKTIQLLEKKSGKYIVIFFTGFPLVSQIMLRSKKYRDIIIFGTIWDSNIPQPWVSWRIFKHNFYPIVLLCLPISPNCSEI
jgi:hypothetical protein